ARMERSDIRERRCDLVRLLPDFACAQSRLRLRASLCLGSRALHAALVDIFLAVDRPNMRGIAIEIRPPNSVLRPVLIDPLPQRVGRNPSAGARPALGAPDIGCKPVSVAAAPAAAVI